MTVIYLCLGAAIAALFFYMGWKLRDSVGVTRGEPPIVVVSPQKNVVLEDWDVPEEADK